MTIKFSEWRKLNEVELGTSWAATPHLEKMELPAKIVRDKIDAATTAIDKFFQNFEVETHNQAWQEVRQKSEEFKIIASYLTGKFASRSPITR